MVWVLLAKFLTSKPPLVQAVVVGMCSGLFVAAAAQANERDVQISYTAGLVMLWGTAFGALFLAGLMYQRRNGWNTQSPAPGWLYAVYALVWLVGLVAALLALSGEGGAKVAALAIVPLVLLAPPAMQGFRAAVHPRSD
jgi:hypothetical protein